jgi:hypothetical protein
MGLAHFEVLHGQPSARISVTLDRVAKPITGSTRLERGEFSRSEKRGRSRLAPGVAIHSLAEFGSISCTPCLAREEICHEALFHGKRVIAQRPTL